MSEQVTALVPHRQPTFEPAAAHLGAAIERYARKPRPTGSAARDRHRSGRTDCATTLELRGEENLRKAGRAIRFSALPNRSVSRFDDARRPKVSHHERVDR